MRLVAAHADWWNVHTHIVDKLVEMRPFAGDARCSLQVQVAYVAPSASRDEIEQTARRRFGPTPVVGTAAELVDYFGALQARGIERVYAWFCDFAPPETLSAFGDSSSGSSAGDARPPQRRSSVFWTCWKVGPSSTSSRTPPSFAERAGDRAAVTRRCRADPHW